MDQIFIFLLYVWKALQIYNTFAFLYNNKHLINSTTVEQQH